MAILRTISDMPYLSYLVTWPNKSVDRTQHSFPKVAKILHPILKSRDSSVVIATGWTTVVLFSIASRLALGPTQPPTQWVLGATYPRGRAEEALI
jgi:hypothetical protein